MHPTGVLSSIASAVKAILELVESAIHCKDKCGELEGLLAQASAYLDELKKCSLISPQLEDWINGLQAAVEEARSPVLQCQSSHFLPSRFIDVLLILSEIIQILHEVKGKKKEVTWKKLEQLGSGSFGSVHRAVSSDGRFFAVKEVDFRSANEQSVIQLQQEIDLLSQLRHENIVQYLGTQRGHEKLYIFLELVTQGSLVSQYKHFKLFDEQLRNYTKQILCGLKYLHDEKVVHRDIKCGNILVHADGTVKLADFGIAKQLENSDDNTKSCKGSVRWMAPEVINPEKTAGFPADIWSLGCTVLEMASGKPPFSDWELGRIFYNVGFRMSKPEIPDCIQEDARDFISECLQVEPLKRPTAAKLLDHPFVNSFPVTTAATEFVEMVDDQSSYESLNVTTRFRTLLENS